MNMANVVNEDSEGISSKSRTEVDERDSSSKLTCTGEKGNVNDDVKLTSVESGRKDPISSTTGTKPGNDVIETYSKNPTLVGTKSDVDFNFKLPPIPASKPKQTLNLDSHDSSRSKDKGMLPASEHESMSANIGSSDKTSTQTVPQGNDQTQSDSENIPKNKSRTGDISTAGDISSSSSSFRVPLPKFNRPQPQKRKLKSGANEKQTDVASSVATSSSQRKKEEASSESPKSISKLSPAEKRAQAIPVPYKEPSWSGLPKQFYHLEVLKGGTIVSRISLNEKPYLVFGRLESCDVMLEHPSLSRFHMVLQYRQVGDSDNDPGFYVYDLDSTHGSSLNKQKIKAKTYCRMQVGHMFKLAGSTRLYILQGPPSDEEAESELSVTELKQMREKQLVELEKQKMDKLQGDEETKQEEEEEKGISWGMDNDDVEDEDPSEDNPFAVMSQEEREALYIKDPKKTLRGFFEREGYELEYDVEERGTGHLRQYICRIELPVDDADGQPITAEAVVSGKKKEVVVACALEACRILDAQGVLRQAKHESKKRKAKNWAEDDYYDSDDDTFLDRTGEIEKKREARMKKAGVIKEEVQTFASLTAKLAEVETEMKQIDADIESLKNASSDSASDDSLDAFMSSIKSGTVLDKTKRAKLKIRRIELRKEEAKLMKLINIAKPAALPQIKRQVTSSNNSSSNTTVSTKKLPMIGSLKGRLGAKKFKFVMPVAKPSTQTAVSSTTDDVEEEEEEEDDDEVEAMETEENVSTQGSSAKDEIVSSSSAVEKKTKDDNDDGEIKMSKPVTKGPSRPPSRSIRGPTLPTKISIKGPTLPPTMKGPILPPTMKGPSLPPDMDRGDQKGPSKRDYDKHVDSDEEGEDEEADRKEMAKKVTIEAEEDVTDWVPPKGQTGDGRTSLNEKYGY